MKEMREQTKRRRKKGKKRRRKTYFFSPPVVGERDRVGEQLRPVGGQREALDGLVLDDLDDLRDGADAGAEEDAVALKKEERF